MGPLLSQGERRYIAEQWHGDEESARGEEPGGSNYMECMLS